MAGFTDYEAFDAVGLAALVARKEVSAEEVTEAAIERIEARNPAVNAVVHRQYEEARRALARGLPAGPLTGVPYLLKDLFTPCAGAPLSNGSRLFEDFVPDYDSTLVGRLRAAGLVILGKTNTPEFGINAATEPVLFGATRNPWNPGHSAGGSSGGGAAAVACGMLPAAHATDGGGSIRIPAANCGLFGLKLTRARNPMGPKLGEGLSGMSGAHAVTRSVRDSAALLDATHGPAPGDPYCAPTPTRPFAEEVGADPGRLRIALMATAPGGAAVDPACAGAAVEAAKLCESLGHRVEEAAPALDAEAMMWAWRVIAAGSLRFTVDDRLRALGRDQRRDDLEPITGLWAEEGRRYTAADYARALLVIHTIGRRFGDFFETYDLLLSPTLAQPPLPLGALDMTGGDLDGYYAALVAHVPFTPQFNASGNPAASLPLHWTENGLPVGVQFGARFGDEATLLRLAGQLEQARPWRDRRPSQQPGAG